MLEKNEFLVETDVLVEHLINNDSSLKSGLEKAMISGICFTTVINASELYFAVQNEEEKKSVDSVLTALKVLGLNARYSLSINEFNGQLESVRDAVICVTAKINKLPILTNKPEKYRFTGLKVLHPKDL